jgi:hypothetical protein
MNSVAPDWLEDNPSQSIAIGKSINFENDEKNGKRMCNLHANPQQLGQ